MTDPDLVAKKLAFIETCVADLRRLAKPEIIDTDLREQRFVEHTLQIAIQAAQDVASHVVSDERFGEPRTNRELFDLLARNAWLDESQAGLLGDMVGFRNLLVHGYGDVDLSVVRDILDNHLDDLLEFVTVVRARVSDPENRE